MDALSEQERATTVVDGSADAPIPPGLLVAAYDDLTPDVRARLARLAGTRRVVFVLGAATQSETLPFLANAHAVRHVLVADSNGRVADLKYTVRRIEDAATPGGLARFIDPDAVSRIDLSCSTERADAVAQLVGATSGVHSAVASLIETVADEFLTNAFFHAPVDDDATHPHSSRPRTDVIHGDVALEFGTDGQRFGVSVRDGVGSLTADRLLGTLARLSEPTVTATASKSGGAGIGLLMAARSVNHFIADLQCGQHTEMMGLIDCSGGYRRFARAGHSINIFPSLPDTVGAVRHEENR